MLITPIGLSAIGFLAANLFFHSLTSLPNAMIWFALPCVALGGCKKASLRFIGVIAIGFFYTWFIAQAQLQITPESQQAFDGGEFTLELKIVSIPVKKASHTRFDAKVITDNQKVPSKVRLSIYYKEADLHLGDQIAAQVKLKPPRGYMNAGGFDYEQYLFTQGIGATGYIKKWTVLKRERLSLLALRGWIYQHIAEQAQKTDTSGLILALAMGERGNLSDRQWNLLFATGTGHLFAISGLHISLIFALFFFPARKIWSVFFLCRTGRPSDMAAAVIALPVAIFYAWLAGFSIPTQRALIMLICFVIGRFYMRPLSLTNTFALALLAVLLFDPLSSLSISFWLSFLAIAMIIFFLSANRTLQGWRKWIGLHVYLPIALLPCSLAFFNQGALIAPLINLFAIPYVSFLVLPVCLLAIVSTLLVAEWGYFFVSIADTLFDVFIFVADSVYNIPHLQWFQNPQYWSYGLASVAVIALVFVTGMRKKALALLWFLPLTITTASIESGFFQAEFLDVGQGLAVVIKTRHHHLLFDTGAAYPSGFNLGRAVVIPYLRHHNIDALDAMVISHGDNDHIGGAEAVMQQFPIHKKWMGGGDIHKGFLPCQNGQQWYWDGVHFEFLYPSINTPFFGNNASCVLKISTQSYSLLLLSDIEKEAESILFRQAKEKLTTTVVQVAHHGSLTSSLPHFIKAMQAQIAIVSSGYRNRFGFPKPAVVERYQQANTTIYNTANSGALRIIFPATGTLKITEYRKENKHYWHAD